MAFYKIWASRVKGDPNDFVGDEGRLFYDDSDGIIRMSDGATQGGVAYIDNSGGGGDATGSLDIYIDDFPLTGSSNCQGSGAFVVSPLSFCVFQYKLCSKYSPNVDHLRYSPKICIYCFDRQQRAFVHSPINPVQ